MRRDVVLECSARSELWEGELRFRVADLSEGGLWVETFLALEVGQELIVAFTPPLTQPEQRVWVSTEVVRTGLARTPGTLPPKRGLGLAIRYCSAEHRRLLSSALRRVPPRLPAGMLAARRERPEAAGTELRDPAKDL